MIGPLVLVVAAGFGIANPVDAGGPILPSEDALLTIDDLPAGFNRVPLSSEPADLCGGRFANLSLPVVPRVVIGRLFMASPADGTVASVEEELLRFPPGDGERFMALVRAQPICEGGSVRRVDGMTMSGAVKPLRLRGLAGDVAGSSRCGPAWGRRLPHNTSRIDQLLIRHGDDVGVLTYASYGFFFDEGVRNRLAQEFSARVSALQ
jgi:hypothetical protein